MTNSKLVGCLGFIVGAFVVVVVGWMAFELLIAVLAGLRLDGFSALIDPLILHDAGELLVIGLTILGVYVWVFRGPGLSRYAQITRPVLWLGAALNAAAALGLWGSRWSFWALILVGIGFAAPVIFARLGETSAPPDQPF